MTFGSAGDNTTNFALPPPANSIVVSSGLRPAENVFWYFSRWNSYPCKKKDLFFLELLIRGRWKIFQFFFYLKCWFWLITALYGYDTFLAGSLVERYNKVLLYISTNSMDRTTWYYDLARRVVLLSFSLYGLITIYSASPCSVFYWKNL